jgi:hypothetical protein
MVKNVDPVGLRIARLAYVMHYSLGTQQAHMMRTRRLHARLCARLGKVPPCDNHIQRENFNASSAQTCSAINRSPMDCDPPYERMAATSACVSGPMHLSCTAKLRSSALYGRVKYTSL